jgi:uncharacterized membrane protein
MWPLIGIAVLFVSFAIRLNPLLGVSIAALATGLAAGLDPYTVVSAFGKAFNANRYLSISFLILPTIGLAESYGLQARVRAIVRRFRGVRTGRLLFVYFLFRQVSSAFGLGALGGQAAMVRPILAPMAEAAEEARHGPPTLETREHIRAHAAASETLALFFGEDVFIAMGSVLLIHSILLAGGFDLPPLKIALWSIPTAVLAMLVHAARMLLLDRRLARRAAASDTPPVVP